MYTRNQQSRAWTLKATLTSGQAGADYFGLSVSCNKDLVAVGAARYANYGAVFVYDTQGNLANPTIVNAPTAEGGAHTAAMFGFSVAVTPQQGFVRIFWWSWPTYKTHVELLLGCELHETFASSHTLILLFCTRTAHCRRSGVDLCHRHQHGYHLHLLPAERCHAAGVAD